MFLALACCVLLSKVTSLITWGYKTFKCCLFKFLSFNREIALFFSFDFNCKFRDCCVYSFNIGLAVYLQAPCPYKHIDHNSILQTIHVNQTQQLFTFWGVIKKLFLEWFLKVYFLFSIQHGEVLKWFDTMDVWRISYTSFNIKK